MKASPLAEAAILGALLVDPAALPQITGWLRSDDFEDPWHGQLFKLLAERTIARQPVDPRAVGLALRDQVGAERADLIRVLGLLRLAPVAPQTQRYAAMVLEGSLRREVAGQGVLLRASALSVSLNFERRPLLAGTALVEQALIGGENRWTLATGGLPSTGVVRAEFAPALRNLDKALAADKLLAAHPDIDTGQVRERERHLIAALISHPSKAAQITSWLPPGALTDRRWRAVYAAVLQLVEQQQPVDVVTVAWQVQQGARAYGPGPELTTLVREANAATVDDPGFYGRAVAADLVRRTAETAARALHAAAEDPAVTVPELFRTAWAATDSVRGAAAGLPERADQHASGRHLSAVRTDPTAQLATELNGPVAG